jgi:hypothetical protein
VHIGSQNDEGIPLNVLQHLAYIIAQYEEIISSFHRAERRGYPSTRTVVYAASNLLGLRDSRCFGRRCLPELTEIQDKIFAEKITASALAVLMGSTGLDGKPSTRYNFVNFENFKLPKLLVYQPQTIEFRQHRGSLDVGAIGQWVCFLTALMRAAEKCARAATPPPSPTKTAQLPHSQWTRPMREGFKYRFVCKNHRHKTDEFFELLELSRQAREHWLKRYALYNPNVFTDAPLSQLCEACKLAEEEVQSSSDLPKPKSDE